MRLSLAVNYFFLFHFYQMINNQPTKQCSRILCVMRYTCIKKTKKYKNIKWNSQDVPADDSSLCNNIQLFPANCLLAHYYMMM